jgi:hypothetical protein
MVIIDIDWATATEIESALALATGLLDAHMPPGSTERPILDMFCALLRGSVQDGHTVGTMARELDGIRAKKVRADYEREMNDFAKKFENLSIKYHKMLVELNHIKSEINGESAPKENLH